MKKNAVYRSTMAYRSAKNVGIVFSVEDLKKHELIKRFKKALENDGKNVSVLAYVPKGHQNFEFLFDFFTIKELDFWGQFNSEAVQKFTSQSFDYLFYLDQEGNPLIRNILAMSKAKCRVGNCLEDNANFCELMIQTHNGSMQNMVDEIYKYTKLLT
ncbi:hypothetical protein FNH22_07380 [Fulvivirga sp. M361]|uniref:DUF6913 domain-containing protein n=1 Tax=Fulvivirga sp. M361 TaxID=2594266 RepID=UPI00117B77A0|nr:hypothetical protein [Fulvivirga sp. M361]TRX60856.1 hypothetical protein FNH22_07380 [Fulvivirga sp. M361]